MDSVPKRRKIERQRRSRQSIPHELISEVLLRLPVKSLLRFRCVSRTWRSLISDPDLIQSHRRRSQQHPVALVRERNYVNIQHDNNAIYVPTGKATLQKIYYDAADFNSINDVNITVFPSSPDLICILESGNRFSLLNPATRERVTLPEFSPRCIDLLYYLGFGYVPSLGKFKVARFFDHTDIDHRSCRVVVEACCVVLTVGVDRSWRPARAPPFAITPDQMAFVNGALHMMPGRVALPESNEGKGVAALDLETEAWRVIPMPRDVSSKISMGTGSTVNLREQRGLLFLDHLLGGGKVEVWVMNDYEKGGWVMEHRIDLGRLQMPEIFRSLRWEGVRPVVISEDGRILIYICWKALLWYDPRDQKITPFPRYANPAVWALQPLVHVENYLPLNGWD